MKGFDLAADAGGKFINWALFGEYYGAWYERKVCSYQGLSGDPDYTLPENRPRNRRFLSRRHTGVLNKIDDYSTPTFGQYVTGDVFVDVPDKIAEIIDPTGIAKHLCPAACRLGIPELYLPDNATKITDPYRSYQPYFQVPAIIYADVDLDDQAVYGVIRDRQATVEILSGTNARIGSYSILYHDKTHLHLDAQALDNWPFSNDVTIRLHTQTAGGEPMTADLENVELVSFGELKPNQTEVFIESIDQYNSYYQNCLWPKVTPGNYTFVSHGHQQYTGANRATLVFDSNLPVCNYYNDDSWETREFYVRIVVNGISYPNSSWNADRWFKFTYQLDQKFNHTRLNPHFWADSYGWRTSSYAQGGTFINTRRLDIYRDITTYCVWHYNSLCQYRNTPFEQVRRGMHTKGTCTPGQSIKADLQEFDQKYTPWSAGNDSGHSGIGAWANCNNDVGYGYASFISRGGCMRWENDQWVYYDGEYNGDIPVIGVGFWGYADYYVYDGSGYRKPLYPLETDLFYDDRAIGGLAAEQIATYGSYLATHEYGKHLAASGDPVGSCLRQPVQWWTFPAGPAANGILPFFRWAPRYPCLTKNWVPDHYLYGLRFNLYTNWAGFLKRDFQYIADRTDDWLY